MNVRISNTLLIGSVFTAFTGTVAATWFLRQPQPVIPPSPSLAILALPEVSAPPPESPAYRLHGIERQLEDLGVVCTRGDCFPDS
jgi:hypothetical protein